MGLFGKLFDKKVCDFCEGEIGLFGNRKLEDGNMCKDCAAKLSPFFSERRKSTVAEIREQLEYREANKSDVAAFSVTRTLGRDTKVLIDEDARKFMVTSSSNYRDVNPDVLNFSQVTGVDLDIEENSDEVYRETNDGDEVSYNPPRYTFRYDFHLRINVNHPYFDEIEFDLGDGVELNGGQAMTYAQRPDPRWDREYKELEDLGNEIKEILTNCRAQAREEAAAAAAPKAAVTCPWCGATTTPDGSGCCEYCGGSVNN